MTPTEWGELDYHEKKYLEEAHQEYIKRANERQESVSD